MRQDKRPWGLLARIGTAGVIVGSLMLPASGAFAASHTTVHHTIGHYSATHHPLLFHPGHLLQRGGTHNADAQSYNWSGYVSGDNLNSGTPRSTSDVKGTWTIPQMQCGPDGYSSAWVGIDGVTDQTVEQTGVEMDCSGGSDQYGAWWEIFPQPAVFTNLNVSPGDQIQAEVRYSGGQFTMSLRDLSTGQGFSKTRSNSGKREEAEWIVEQPCVGSCSVPLADYGTETFSRCTATVDGSNGSINSAPQDLSIDMVTRGGTVRSRVSGLNGSGMGFSTTWQHR